MRPEKRFSAHQVQTMMTNFCLNPRPWLAYPTHHVECVMRFNNAIGPDWYYSRYDTANEEAVFQGPVTFESVLKATLPKELEGEVEILSFEEHDRTISG